MASVFRMHPDDLEKKMNFIGLNNLNNNTFNFLDNIKDKSIVKSIIIMNLLQQYIYPLK